MTAIAIPIIRDGSGFAPLSSLASLLAGTATQGTDSTVGGGATGTVTFTAGSETATVTVDPTADTSVEPDETGAFTLTAGTGYTIGTTAAVVGTIANDDAPATPPPIRPRTRPVGEPFTA
jgi:hypothetical protein